MLLVSGFRPNANVYGNRNNSVDPRIPSKADSVCFTSTKDDIAKKTSEISTKMLRQYPDVLGDNFKLFTQQLNSFLKENKLTLHSEVLESKVYGEMQLETVRGAGNLGLGHVKEMSVARFSDKSGKLIGATQMQPTKNAAIVQALIANVEIIQNKLKIELPHELKNRLRRLDIALSVTNTKWMDEIKTPHDCDLKAQAYQTILEKLMPEDI